METTKKYELVESYIKNFGGFVYRINCGINQYHIKACKTFETADGKIVHAGDIGGTVNSERNLSQDGRAWIF